MTTEHSAHSAAHTDLLAGELSPHQMQMNAMECVPPDGGASFTFQNFYLGLGGLLVAQVCGDTQGPEFGGHPSPTIAEAQAIHAEMIRRWNAFPAIFDALPFPAIQAGTADSLAFQLEKNGTFGTITPESVAIWLRHIAKQLNALHALSQSAAIAKATAPAA